MKLLHLYIGVFILTCMAISFLALHLQLSELFTQPVITYAKPTSIVVFDYKPDEKVTPQTAESL